jgi:AraC-like DNA-binding protein
MVLAGFFDPIKLDKSFPVSTPDFKTPPDRAHVHDCFEIGLCSSGAGIFMIGDKIFNCMPGDAIFINHQEFHILKDASPVNADWKFVNLDPAMLLAGWIPVTEDALNISALSGKSFCNVIHESEYPEIVFTVRQLFMELERKSKNYKSLVRSLVWGLMINLQRLSNPDNERTTTEPAEIQRIYPALQYISSHYADNIEIEKLAGICHYSVSTFRRVFKRNLGCLPLDYLIDYRLKVAVAGLTASDKSILEIASNSGFTTLSNFNRHFKEKYQQTPRDFRNHYSFKFREFAATDF